MLAQIQICLVVVVCVCTAPLQESIYDGSGCGVCLGVVNRRTNINLWTLVVTHGAFELGFLNALVKVSVYCFCMFYVD